MRVGNHRGSLVIRIEPFEGVQRGVAIIESLWPNDAFEEGRGVNVLTGADAVAPTGGAAFHDNRVWIRSAVGDGLVPSRLEFMYVRDRACPFPSRVQVRTGPGSYRPLRRLARLRHGRPQGSPLQEPVQAPEHRQVSERQGHPGAEDVELGVQGLDLAPDLALEFGELLVDLCELLVDLCEPLFDL